MLDHARALNPLRVGPLAGETRPRELRVATRRAWWLAPPNPSRFADGHDPRVPDSSPVIFTRCPQRQRWYHTFMDKTTIYLPTELKSAIKRVARQRGVSEA